MMAEEKKENQDGQEEQHAIDIESQEMYHIRTQVENETLSLLSSVTMDDLSRPYYHRNFAALKMCRFNCFRGTTYGLAFLCGFFKWLVETFMIVFGCRSTFQVLPDEEFTRMFAQDWPFSYWVQKSSMIIAHGKAEEIQVVSTHDMLTMQQYAFPGMFIEPVRATFRRLPLLSNSEGWRLYSLEIKGEIMYAEQDGNSDAWALAKLYLMSGIQYFVILSHHPFIHFCQDVFIATTNEVFPEADNELRQLLDPHSEFTIGK